MTHDKSLQKEIVSLANAKNVLGLTELLEVIGGNDSEFTDRQQEVKMAINLTSNIVFGSGLQAEFLARYTEALEMILQKYPALQKLESICYARIKASLELNRLNVAEAIAMDCSEPRLRLFSVILDEWGKRGDSIAGFRLLDAMHARGLDPTDQDFANVVLSLQDENCSRFMERFNELLDLFQNYRDCFEANSLVNAIFEAATRRGFKAWRDIDISDIRESGECGVCPKTGIKLQRIDLSDSDLEEMIGLSRRLSTEASRLRYGEDYPDEFDQVMEKLQSPIATVIIDAANIAHTNQNYEGGFFRFDQIESVRSHFKSLGRKCLVVIHEKWLAPHRDLQLFFLQPQQGESKPNKITKRKRKCGALPQLGETLVEGRPCEISPDLTNPESITDSGHKHEVKHPVPVDIIQRWREDGELLEVPHGQNDDWFWMYVCLVAKKCSSEEIILVSNDQMRDHLWRMKNPKFFPKFRSNHICQYSIKYGEDKINHFEYHMPPPFSNAIQKHDIGGRVIYHIPYKAKNDCGLEIVRWLVIEM